MGTILTAEDRFGNHPQALPADRMAEHAIHYFWHRTDAPQAVPKEMAKASLPVMVNDSRWVVQCPTCKGAQIAARQDRRFFCVDCLNSAYGGRWVRVVWPKDVEAIEDVLMRRPLAHTRAWLPGQSVKDLQRENEDHGVPD